MTTLALTAWPAPARALFPGVLACGVVAAAATFLSQHYGAPVMLFALLLGLAMNFLSAEGPCAPGIEFSARQLLRVGVALLGLRITAAQVVALGWQPVVLVVLSVALTIGVAKLAARGRHLPRRHDPRCGAGGWCGLRPVARDGRRGHAGQADARGDAAAGDRACRDPGARARRRRQPAAAAAALVPRGLRRAGGAEQPRLDPGRRAERGQRRVALVPGGRHRRRRHEDAAEGPRHGR